MRKNNNKHTDTPELRFSFFGDRLYEVMKQQGLSNANLAAIIFVSPTTISGYRTGRRSPNVEGLVSLCTALKVSADYLLGLTDSPTLLQK